MSERFRFIPPLVGQGAGDRLPDRRAAGAAGPGREPRRRTRRHAPDGRAARGRILGRRADDGAACCWRFRSRPRGSSSSRPRPDARPNAPKSTAMCSMCCPTRSRSTPSADPTIAPVGLYETPVYTARVQIAGEFVNRDFAQLLAGEAGPRSEMGRGAAARAQFRIARAARGRRSRRRGRAPAGRRRRIRRLRRHLDRGADRGAARGRHDPVPHEAHARRQQPAHVSCRSRARRTSRSSRPGRIRSSKARRRRSIR